MKRIAINLGLILSLGLGLTLALVWLLSARPPIARAAGPLLYVAPNGSDTTDCTDFTQPCLTIQYAVDQADAGAEIRMATGVYTGVNAYGGLSQVVYISTTMALRGGYTTTNWTVPYPITQPTTLDAEGQGRVMYIAGPGISVTLENLGITRGYVSGMLQFGGGIYAANVMLTMSNCVVLSNIASGPMTGGGGMYVLDSHLAIRRSQLISNAAIIQGTSAYTNAAGGGLYADSSILSLDDNVIASNVLTPQIRFTDVGGGIFLFDNTSATLNRNFILSNSAGSGGGLGSSDLGRSIVALLNENVIASNYALFSGGVGLGPGTVTLNRNTICSNTAFYGPAGFGTGSATVTLTGNHINSNIVITGDGGGVVIGVNATAILTGNVIVSNVAAQRGGGIEIYGSDTTLINNIIADNRAASGSGVFVGLASPRFIHTTIARNTGGTGFVVGFSPGSNALLTDTILVGHSVGVSVSAGNTATLEATLWGSGAWANQVDWAGEGSIVTGTVNAWGDPGFVNPAAGDYHILPGSAAIDAGIDAGVDFDIDGNRRPLGAGFDIGADEVASTLYVANGVDVGDCADPANPCATVQYAVDQAEAGAEIRVATGVYTGVSARPRNDVVATGVVTQVVYISKTVTVRGGYTTTNWTEPYPITQPTTLDAQGQGRVMYVTGGINVTLERLRLTDGMTAVPPCGPTVAGSDDGSGLYAISATLVMSGNDVFNNVSGNTACGPYPVLNSGGGLHVLSGTAVLTANRVFSNVGWTNYGGGVSLRGSIGVLVANSVYSNMGATDYGGGLSVLNSSVVLSGNVVASNTLPDGHGSGIYLMDVSAIVLNNAVFNNSSNPIYNFSLGGGLFVSGGDVLLDGNWIASNYSARGGGLYLESSPATMRNNTIISNTAEIEGGGVHLWNSAATLSENTIVSNAVVGDHRLALGGGGIALWNSPAILDRNTVMSNASTTFGGGASGWGVNAQAIFTGNTFVGNHADVAGGLILRSNLAAFNDNLVGFNSSISQDGGVVIIGSSASIKGNTIVGNATGYYCGGLTVGEGSSLLLESNTVISNSALRLAGGICLGSASAILSNTIVSDNWAGVGGSGIYVSRGSLGALHTTIARNAGSAGLEVADAGTASLANTILVSHSIGISVAAGNTATLEATLWGSGAWANQVGRASCRERV